MEAYALVTAQAPKEAVDVFLGAGTLTRGSRRDSAMSQAGAMF